MTVKYNDERRDTMSTREIRLTIIDEDPIFVDALKRMAENADTGDWTLSVDTYTDGQAFLLTKPEEGKQTHIIISTDILSKRSGVNITQTLRQLPNHNRFYIILLTQGRSQDELVHAIKSGVDHYLPRPVNIQGLQATIERLIERQAYD